MQDLDPLARWFRRAMNTMNRAAEVGHGAKVQRRAMAAVAASVYATRTDAGPAEVPAVRHLELMRQAAPESLGDKLLDDFLALAPELAWRASERSGDGGADVALVDLYEHLDMGLAGAGAMLLGPGAGYPEHQHRPAEVYLVLHGSRRWRFGGSDRYVRVDQGQVLSNSSMDIHGVEPGDDVMLAIWVLMDDRY